MSNRTRSDFGSQDLTELRRKLAGSSGPQYWRSLEELAGTEEFERYRHREFPEQASEWHDPVGRRQFLQLMGASLALAGVSGCVVRPEDKLVPYVKAPEQIVPGKPLFYASTAVHEGYGTGILVESHLGRPTKVEGNPTHPASLGASDLFTQASILNLYDPDRSQAVTYNGRVSSWDAFLNAMIELRTAQLASKGAGVRFLSGTVTSPTVVRLMDQVLGPKFFPQARWHQYEPVGHANRREGVRLATGVDAEAVHHIDQADVVVSLDADFLGWGPAKLVNARQLTARREPGPDNKSPIRLYVVEPSPTITGATADHRWPLSTEEIQSLAATLARAVGVNGLPAAADELKAPWVATLVADLQKSKGKSLVIAGETQAPAVHALAHAINAALGNVGHTVTYHEPVAASAPAGQSGSIADLADDIRAGRVETLFILGTNPVYDAPIELGFAPSGSDSTELLLKVRTVVHLGLYNDETGQVSTWHIPEAHFLESWGDARAFDGTASIMQPLISPLYSGRTAAELLSVVVDGSPLPSRSLVEATWRANQSDADFSAFWSKTLHDGVVAGSAAKPKDVSVKSLADLAWPKVGTGKYEILFRPDPTIWDGSFSNNGWLQELPKPMTRVVWDNPALISKKTADNEGVKDGDVIKLTMGGRILKVPVWINPGHAEDAITLTLGYGRNEEAGYHGRVGAGAGFNTYSLRSLNDFWAGRGVLVEKTGETYPLYSTQGHNTMVGRDLIRTATHTDYAHNPHIGPAGHAPAGHEAAVGNEHDAAASPHDQSEETGIVAHGANPPKNLIGFEYPEPMQRRNDGFGNRWGMSINLNACIGCAACVVACQAENNIPVVGKDQVGRGREMHWLRIDRYYATASRDAEPSANPATHFQPVPCMHCETAPCEMVCPVEATSHSAEGLNEMTYNRCVGTRYCSNNCPYKVRRFNFFQYSDQLTESLKLQRNPDVSVRTRGVMEKCTYCVQRLTKARIEAQIKSPDGFEFVSGDSVATACQQACPTRAIVFGNMNDPKSAVAKAKVDPRNYSLLAELNTRPRTTYLAKLTNPNTAIEA